MNTKIKMTYQMLSKKLSTVLVEVGRETFQDALTFYINVITLLKGRTNTFKMLVGGAVHCASQTDCTELMGRPDKDGGPTAG